MNRDHLLAACVCSGQASAEQVHQHVKAGELPVQMLGTEPNASDFTTVQSAEHRRLVHLADVGATVLIEAYARRELRTFGDARNIYDYTTPDEEELPDEETREETAADLAMAAAHLFARELIFRPWDDKPQLVAFVGRPK